MLRLVILNAVVIVALQLLDHFYPGPAFWLAAGVGLGISSGLGYLRGYDRGYRDMLDNVIRKVDEIVASNVNKN